MKSLAKVFGIATSVVTAAIGCPTNSGENAAAIEAAMSVLAEPPRTGTSFSWSKSVNHTVKTSRLREAPTTGESVASTPDSLDADVTARRDANNELPEWPWVRRMRYQINVPPKGCVTTLRIRAQAKIGNVVLADPQRTNLSEFIKRHIRERGVILGGSFSVESSEGERSVVLPELMRQLTEAEEDLREVMESFLTEAEQNNVVDCWADAAKWRHIMENNIEEGRLAFNRYNQEDVKASIRFRDYLPILAEVDKHLQQAELSRQDHAALLLKEKWRNALALRHAVFLLTAPWSLKEALLLTSRVT